MVVYGHTPVPEAEWVNDTICIDTGCVFGGKLTALRYPERELVQADAHEIYYEPAKPLESARQNERPRDLLDISDVTGKRIVPTRGTWIRWPGWPSTIPSSSRLPIGSWSSPTRRNGPT
jgi:protein phosphatase